MNWGNPLVFKVQLGIARRRSVVLSLIEKKPLNTGNIVPVIFHLWKKIFYGCFGVKVNTQKKEYTTRGKSCSRRGAFEY